MMSWIEVVRLIVALVSVVFLLGLAVFVATHRREPVTVLLVAMILLLALGEGWRVLALTLSLLRGSIAEPLLITLGEVLVSLDPVEALIPVLFSSLWAHFFCVYPMPFPWLAERRYRLLILYLPNLLLIALIALTRLPGAVPDETTWWLAQCSVLLSPVSGLTLYLFGLLALLRSIRCSTSMISRHQLRLLLAGPGVAVLLMIISDFLPNFFRLPYPLMIEPFLEGLPALLFAGSLAYAIQRYQFLNLNLLISRSLVYTVLALILTGVYISVLGGTGFLAEGLTRSNNPLPVAFFVALATLVLLPVYQWLQRQLDRLFYRPRYNYLQTLQSFSRDLASLIALPSLPRLIIERVAGTLQLDTASLWLRDPDSGNYRLRERYEVTRRLSADFEFSPADPFVSFLRRQRGPIYRYTLTASELGHLSAVDQERVNQLRAVVFVPLMLHDHLVGWLNLGAKRSGEVFTQEDLALLGTLADQAAVALENQALYAQAQRRVSELAVLNEISRAISGTLQFDQVMTLIWKETNRILDAKNFYLALYDERRDEISFPLVIERGQRVNALPQYVSKNLVEYVIHRQCPVRIGHDWEKAMAHLEIVSDMPGAACSWLGVPMIMRGKAIGMIGLYDQEQADRYTPDDEWMLSAIANQAAIAIENARLYTQTDQALARRVAELSAVEAIDRELSATLDYQRILNIVLERVAEAAGQAPLAVIGMHDPGRGGLFILADRGFPPEVIAPYRHLPWSPQRGLIGRAIRTGQTVLVNRVSEDPDYIPSVPSTAAEMVVPIYSKGQVVGIVDVQSPRPDAFSPDQARLIEHIVEHAVLAIENARLYERQVAQSQQLARRAQQLTEILRVGNVLTANLNLSQILEQIVQAVQVSLGFNHALLSLVDEQDSRYLRRVAAAGIPPEQFEQIRTARPLVSQYLAVMREEFRSGQAYYISHHHADVLAVLQPNIVTFDLGERQEGEWHPDDLLFVPLWGSDKRLIGILSVDDPQDRQIPTRETLEVLEVFANQATVAIENSRLFATVRSQMTEIRAALERMDRLNEQLREANRLKTLFLANMSHELRTPMNSIIGYTEVLLDGLDGPLNEDQRQSLIRVRRNARSLLQLINDILDLSKIEAGTVALQLEGFNLHDAVEAALSSVEPLAQNKGLTLKVELPPDLPPVFGDPGRTRQVLLNLLSNAIKFTRVGGVTLSARVATWPEIEQLGGQRNSLPPEGGAGQAEEAVVLISIADTGIGIPDEYRQTIFDEFRQVDGSSTREFGGVGLGLAIARRLVLAQGGQIWLQSQVGVGSTFYFYLPVNHEQ